MILDRSLGPKIKLYMKENGISQTHIANKIGMPLAIFNALLNGNRNLLAEEYFMICDALGVPLDAFKERQVV